MNAVQADLGKSVCLYRAATIKNDFEPRFFNRGFLFSGVSAAAMMFRFRAADFERRKTVPKPRDYFVSDPQSSFFETAVFQKIMAFVASKGRIMGLSIKQTNKELIVVQDEVRSMKGAKGMLEQLVVGVVS